MYSIRDFWGCGTRPFTIEELKRFFRNFDIKNREEKRTRLYFLIQFYLGMRKHTVDIFNLKGICWKRRIYRVVGDKGKNRYSNKGRRDMPIPYELFYHLKEYYESDFTDIRKHNGYFFYNSKSDIPSESEYARRFREHIKKAGLEEVYMKADDGNNLKSKGSRNLYTLVTHSYRKSYSAYLIENGCDLATLMDLLGHTSFLSTHKYTKLALRRKIDIISKAFDGKVIKPIIKPLILLNDTPYVETKESIVNVAITREQLDILTRMGVINPERNMAEII